MLDKFHSKNHTMEKCRTVYNPKTKANKRLLNRFRVKNTQKAEQIWGRFFNRHYNTQWMKKLSYRAFLRHLCISYNKSMRCSRKYR